MNKPKYGLILLILPILTGCYKSGAPQAEETPIVKAEATSIPETSPTQTASPTMEPEVQMEEGDYAIFAGDYKTAIDTFQAALTGSSEPDVIAESNLGLGKAYYYQGNLGSGLNYLRTAAEADDPQVAARANYLLGKTYTGLERYDEALQAYQTYLEFQPGLIDSHIHELMGNLYKILGNYPQAIQSFEEAYRTDPDGGNESLTVKIAAAYDESGNDGTALALYQDIYNTSDNDYTKAQMDLLIGRIYYSQEAFETAYTYFQDAVNNFPLAYDAYSALVTLVNDGVTVNEFQRGLINYNVGNYNLAIEAFDRYLAQSPETDADSALYFKALATRAVGVGNGEADYEEAIAIWQTIIDNYPASAYFIDAWEDIEYTQWAYLDDSTAAADTALLFAATYAEETEAADFMYLAGRDYERAGMLVEAAETWGQIATTHPESEYAFQASFYAGIALVRTGDWAAAQRAFSKASVIAYNPEEVAATHLWIGKCHEAQGDISAALDSWKQAQTADPFGYYSIRAEDLLLERSILAEPSVLNLNPDLGSYRTEAETWVRETFSLPADTNLESPGLLVGDPRYTRGMEYWALGMYEEGKAEFESMRQEYDSDPAQTFRLIPLLVEIGLYRSAVAASTSLLKSAGLEGGSALDAPEFFSRIRFGAYYLDWVLPAAESESLSPILLLSVMRQESSYEGFIGSGAGALGLMQIIPETGAQLANDLNWPEDYSSEDLYRPYISLVFGANYLNRQRNYFNGNLYAMLAAYNGGPGNTIYWESLAPDDPDLLLEVIRIEETRNYIRLVTEIHYIYRWLYGSEMSSP
jgi:soluble lytic murein transglycosylase